MVFGEFLFCVAEGSFVEVKVDVEVWFFLSEVGGFEVWEVVGVVSFGDLAYCYFVNHLNCFPVLGLLLVLVQVHLVICLVLIRIV